MFNKVWPVAFLQRAEPAGSFIFEGLPAMAHSENNE